jgi:hypothetical protein
LLTEVVDLGQSYIIESITPTVPTILALSTSEAATTAAHLIVRAERAAVVLER